MKSAGLRTVAQDLHMVVDMVADDFVLALPGMRPRRPPPAQLHRNALSELAIRELRMQIARCGTEIPE